MTKRDDEAVQIYGALVEGVYLGSFTFERAFGALKQLLVDGRWKSVGDFPDVHGFIESVGFEKYRVLAEERAQIVKLIKEQEPKTSNRQIAKAMKVGKDTINRAVAHNAPDAEKKTNQNKDGESTTGARRATTGTKAAKIVERRTTDIGVTQERRADKEERLGAKIAELPDAKFGVILADPEWHDEVYSEETGMNRHASRVYTTSSNEDIKQRPVKDIAADDCVLFLWSTNQHLDVAIEVLHAWGFEYASHYIWRKPSVGLGFWNRSVHEVLLIGTRGKPPAPAKGTQWVSVIDAARGELHSAKPEIFLEMIEEYFPNMPKIELNRRGPARPGWSAWGNEAATGVEAAVL